LPHWPADPAHELYALQALAPFGTFSHDTALTLLGLTDIIPSTIHFTIPETSRLRPRPGVTLHRSRRGAMTDRNLRDGLWVNTARRALLDATREGADPDQLISAARDARERAMLTPDDLASLRRHPPFAGSRL
jgi:predicted transcriptional regulator of viral defense system